MKCTETAKRLSYALGQAGMRPQELSNKSGVGKSSISQYLNGSHSPSNISSGKMGAVLGVNPLWLMGFDVDMFERKTLDLSQKEYLFLTKYRSLDEQGREILDIMVDHELERIKSISRKYVKATITRIPGKGLDGSDEFIRIPKIDPGITPLIKNNMKNISKNILNSMHKEIKTQK